MNQNEKLVLEVSKLTVVYKKKEKAILKDLSFTVREGEILGLVGKSGSGKSTLSKAILGMVKKESGTIVHHTHGPQMIFQDPYSSLNPSKKIGWILEEPLRLQKLEKTKRKEKVVQMLLEVGLEEELLSRYPRELSGGQRQRICIATALLTGANFILADEPVSALDVTIQKQILELLVRVQKEHHLTYLFVSHDLAVVSQICDRILVMDEGRIVEQGFVEEIYRNPKEQVTKELLEASLFIS